MSGLNRTVVDTVPGDLYHKNCLNCYELHAENHGDWAYVDNPSTLTTAIAGSIEPTV